jgi:ligand-binding sensor domain-containing protein
MPVFPVGLVAALDNDGVWILRGSNSWTRWLSFDDDISGLPSRYTRAVLADARGFIWVATLAGVARISPALEVRTFASDSLLSRRANVFLLGPDASLYVGLDIGLARIDDPDGPAPRGTRIPGVPGPVVALASTDARVWWSDGQRVSSLAGDSLDWPLGIAANLALEVNASRDTVWVGHPFGEMSLRGRGSDWIRIGRAEGLPPEDVRSFLAPEGVPFVGTSAGLYVHTGGSGPLHFVRVEAGPDNVSAQAIARGVHWAGGSGGLWKREAGGWTQVPLWAGATAIVDLASRGDTLWASAGHGGVAWSVGGAWIQAARNPNLASLYFGRLAPAADGRLAIATDRGLALWNGLNVEPVVGSPDDFLTDVAWWGARIACGTYHGLWVREPRGAWRMFGVTEGLPGAQVQSLSTDASGDLWIGTNRGLGRMPAIADDTPTDANGPDTLLGSRTSRSGFRVLVGPRSVSRLEPGSIVRVFDVRGRLLRTLEISRGGFEWSGQDARGRRAPEGIYFAQVQRPAGAVRVQRILVLH